ncbi:MAG: hypothetical protein OES38_03545, partial [Gammaproteobacteria bacterium]|nr:hypothetical protein [Gammaproteobacteria bacterium]
MAVEQSVQAGPSDAQQLRRFSLAELAPPNLQLEPNLQLQSARTPEYPALILAVIMRAGCASAPTTVPADSRPGSRAALHETASPGSLVR